jgi:Amidohydrolase family
LQQNFLELDAMRTILGSMLICIFSFLPIHDGLLGQDLAIEHVQVVDVVDGKILSDQTVIVSAGKIREVGPAAKIVVPAEATRIDGQRRYLIPGLWDMHIHWYDRESMKLFPINGVVGVRIMAGFPQHRNWQEAFESGTALGPHLLIGSPIIDGPSPIWPGSFSAGSEEEAKTIFDRAVAMKPDFLKVYSLLPRDVYLAIVKQAKAGEIPFAGHVPLTVSIAEASDAGQATMEHLYEFAIACSSIEDELRKMREQVIAEAGSPRGLYDNKELAATINQRAVSSFDEAKAKALFARLAKNRTWQCPTLTVLRNLAFLETPEIQNNPNLKYVPSSFRSMIAPAKDKNGRSPEAFARSQENYRWNLKLLRQIHKAGVPILAGTDCLNPFCLPGFSMHDELGLLVEAGLTPLEALRAATLNPAIFQKQEDQFGSIRAGLRADMVLLNANPLEDISNTKSIEAVFLNGKYIDQQQRTKMLDEIEKR